MTQAVRLTQTLVQETTKHNALTQQNAYRLARYIELHRDRLVADRPPLAEEAERACAELGFKVTAHNIEAARKTTGIEWRAQPRRRPRAHGPTLVDVVEAVRVLAREAAKLRDYMGEPVPSEIDSLIGFGMPEKAAR